MSFADAIIRFVTNAREAGADVAKTRDELTKTGEGAKGSVSGVKKATEDLGEAAKEVVSPIRSMLKEFEHFVGLPAIILGTATAIATSLDKVFNRKEDARASLDELTSGLRSLRNELAQLSASGQHNSLDDAINALSKRTIEATASSAKSASEAVKSATVWKALLQGPLQWANDLVDDPKEIAAEQASAAKQASALFMREKQKLRDDYYAGEQDKYEQSITAQTEMEKARIEDIRKQTQEINDARLEGVDAIYAKEKRDIEELRRQRAKSQSEDEQEALDRQIEAIKRRTQAESDAVTHAAEEAASKFAAAFSAEITGAISKLADAQRSFTQAQFSSIAADVSRISQVIDARLRSVGNGT